jgi:hypothetical protein
MSLQLTKKELYMSKYPKGTIIELTAPIDDPYTPKPAGARFKVDFIDDMLQLHGTWLSPAKGSMAIEIGHDSFKVVSRE